MSEVKTALEHWEKRCVVVSASADEARRLRHTHLGVEHVFIALLNGKQGVAIACGFGFMILMFIPKILEGLFKQ